jgi:hypothetical protein
LPALPPPAAPLAARASLGPTPAAPAAPATPARAVGEGALAVACLSQGRAITTCCRAALQRAGELPPTVCQLGGACLSVGRGVFVSWAGRVCQLGGACLSVGRGVFVSWAGRVCQLGGACLSVGRGVLGVGRFGGNHFDHLSSAASEPGCPGSAPVAPAALALRTIAVQCGVSYTSTGAGFQKRWPPHSPICRCRLAPHRTWRGCPGTARRRSEAPALARRFRPQYFLTRTGVT